MECGQNGHFPSQNLPYSYRLASGTWGKAKELGHSYRLASGTWGKANAGAQLQVSIWDMGKANAGAQLQISIWDMGPARPKLGHSYSFSQVTDMGQGQSWVTVQFQSG